MKRLIKALQIIERYNPKASTFCSHDLLTICGVEPYEVTIEDTKILEECGFHIGDESGETSFESWEWGSC